MRYQSLAGRPLRKRTPTTPRATRLMLVPLLTPVSPSHEGSRYRSALELWADGHDEVVALLLLRDGHELSECQLLELVEYGLLRVRPREQEFDLPNDLREARSDNQARKLTGTEYFDSEADEGGPGCSGHHEGGDGGDDDLGCAEGGTEAESDDDRDGDEDTQLEDV